MRRTSYAAIGLAVIAVGAAGCGSSKKSSSSASTPASTPAASTPAASTPATSTPATSTPAASGGAGGTVTVGESEFKLTPKAATAKSGKVTIDVKNDGQIVHNLNIEGNGIAEKKTADLQPGSSGKLTVALKPGKYEMYCSIDGHRASGMEGTLTVS
jgi:uncharacterized cupredoxin-like copper-binding protein